MIPCVGNLLFITSTGKICAWLKGVDIDRHIYIYTEIDPKQKKELAWFEEYTLENERLEPKQQTMEVDGR